MFAKHGSCLMPRNIPGENPDTLFTFKLNPHTLHIFIARKQTMDALYFAGSTWPQIRGEHQSKGTQDREHSACPGRLLLLIRLVVLASSVNTWATCTDSSRPPDCTRGSLLGRNGDGWARGRPTASLNPGDYEILFPQVPCQACQAILRAYTKNGRVDDMLPQISHNFSPPTDIHSYESSRRGRENVKIRVCLPRNAVIWPPPPSASCRKACSFTASPAPPRGRPSLEGCPQSANELRLSFGGRALALIGQTLTVVSWRSVLQARTEFYDIRTHDRIPCNRFPKACFVQDRDADTWPDTPGSHALNTSRGMLSFTCVSTAPFSDSLDSAHEIRSSRKGLCYDYTLLLLRENDDGELHDTAAVQTVSWITAQASKFEQRGAQPNIRMTLFSYTPLFADDTQNKIWAWSGLKRKASRRSRLSSSTGTPHGHDGVMIPPDGNCVGDNLALFQHD
ncbi:hypothetical protein CCUS01_15349 [Colletotrichum cuscutae]|uniref:Uncharacterized protein n=1 Tax=Colletotrichum cuscutae TaxID=1209917 RepID=A0AAI9VFA6_9PEZI|nr:hypothetical protein CCUS01_15349 [Colletotrichum cuscutae]